MSKIEFLKEIKMDFLIASGNAHKGEEFNHLFKGSSIQVKTPLEKVSVVEDRNSYQENAFLKAKGYFDKYKVPVLSDDSGIEVPYLPDELGIHSARFGGEDLNDQDRCLRLLEKMEKALGDERKAHFVCVLCFYLSPDEVFYFEGRMNGTILSQMKGEGGFGYDPIFNPLALKEGDFSSDLGPKEEVSVAMVPDWKAKNSHRAQAVQLARKFFSES
jgi:XTP/dITP diphosphohydrolase